MRKLILLLLLALPAFGQVTIGGSNFPLINAGPPPNCQVGVPYAVTFTVIGGVAPITWSLINGTTLPPGLNLNSSNGLVSGTCTTQGTTTFQMQVKDAVGNFSSQQFSITAIAQLMINAGAFPAATQSVSYTSSPYPTAAGGTTPYAWTCCTIGSLPPGLSMASGTGFVTGTPSLAGTYNFTFKVTDFVGNIATLPGTIVVQSSAPTCGPPGYLCTSVTQAVIQAPTAPFSGGTGINTIACDPSINGSCSSTSGTDPIVRLTDSTVGATGFTVDPSGGSGDNIFASDDSKIALIPQNTGSTCVMGFTPSTMQTNGICTPIPASHSVYWAHTNSNVMYSLPSAKPSGSIGGTTCNAPCVVKTTFSSPTAFTQTVVVDPTVACATLIPSGTYSGGSISLSNDDNIVYAAILTNQQNSPGYVFAYNQTTHQCSALWTGAATSTNNVLLFNGTLANATFSCTPFGLHNSNIFLNGTYARMTVGAIGTCNPTAQYWQLNTNNVFQCPSPISGHNSNGWNIEVEISNPTYHWGNVTSGTYCSDINSQTYGSGLNLQNGQSGDIENHFGLNNISVAETQPVLVGTSWADRATITTPWVAPTVNEMWAFQRSPFLIQRFTHLFNSSNSNCSSCDFRETEGIVTQSQTGKFGAFCSSMNQGLGTSSNGQRIDVFIVRLD